MEKEYMEHWIKISGMRHTQRMYKKGVQMDKTNFMIWCFDGEIPGSSFHGRRTWGLVA